MRAYARSGRLNQVPAIAERIAENRHCAIGFAAWFFPKFHTVRRKNPMNAVKIICFEKKPDPAAGLVVNGGNLALIIGPGQRQARVIACRRADDDPALDLIRLDIFDQVKAEVRQ